MMEEKDINVEETENTEGTLYTVDGVYEDPALKVDTDEIPVLINPEEYKENEEIEIEFEGGV